jgi:hypothetical protein
MCAQSLIFSARWVFRHARGDNTSSPLRAYAIGSAPKLSPKELRLRSDESPLHIDFACKLCGFRTAIGELLARHLSRSHGVKRKSSTRPRGHGVEGLTLQSWDRDGADGHWIVGLDHSAAATSSLDNSLPQDSVSPLRLERSHREGLERMADPNRKLLVGIMQMPHGRGQCIKLGDFDDLALCSCPKQSSKSSTRSPRRLYLSPYLGPTFKAFGRLFPPQSPTA